MGHAGTDQQYYDQIVQFADDIRMVPLCLHKEQPGYILNSMLVPFLSAAEALYATDVADPETIDKTWMLATGAPNGPFRILDVVGLVTAYNIVSMNPAAADPESTPGKICAKLKEMIARARPASTPARASTSTSNLHLFWREESLTGDRHQAGPFLLEPSN